METIGEPKTKKERYAELQAELEKAKKPSLRKKITKAMKAMLPSRECACNPERRERKVFMRKMGLTGKQFRKFQKQKRRFEREDKLKEVV